MKPDDLKIGEPGWVHHGRVFKRLYIGYSPEHGQRFYVPISPLLADIEYSVVLEPPLVIMRQQTKKQRFMGLMGSVAMMQAYNAPHGFN